MHGVHVNPELVSIEYSVRRISLTLIRHRAHDCLDSCLKSCSQLSGVTKTASNTKYLSATTIINFSK
jgi:hypothetical protein